MYLNSIHKSFNNSRGKLSFPYGLGKILQNKIPCQNVSLKQQEINLFLKYYQRSQQDFSVL